MGRPVNGAVAGAAAVAVLALAGCSDKQGPTVDDPVESSSSEPTAPTSPTNSGAAEPEPWEEKSKAGAKAFASYWIDTLNEAQMTGDTQQLRDTSLPGCASCSDIADQLDAVYNDGGSIKTSGWRVLRSATPPGPMTEDTDIVLRIDRPTQRVENADGSIQKFGGGEATFSLQISWQDSGWQVRELARL